MVKYVPIRSKSPLVHEEQDLDVQGGLDIQEEQIEEEEED